MATNKTKENHCAFVPFDWSSDIASTLVRTPLEDHLKYSLRSLLLTRLGERPFHPQYGSTVLDLLFRPFSPELRTELCNRVRQAISQSEPRVELIDVDVQRSPQEPSRLLVILSYQIKETQKKDRMNLQLQT